MNALFILRTSLFVLLLLLLPVPVFATGEPMEIPLWPNGAPFGQRGISIGSPVAKTGTGNRSRSNTKSDVRRMNRAFIRVAPENQSLRVIDGTLGWDTLGSPSPLGRGRMVHRLSITRVLEFAQRPLAKHQSDACCSLSLRERVWVRGKYSVERAKCSIS